MTHNESDAIEPDESTDENAQPGSDGGESPARKPMEGVTWTDEDHGIVEVELTDPMIEWLDLEVAEHKQSSVPAMIQRILRQWLAEDLAGVHGETVSPEIDLPVEFATRARLYHNHGQVLGNDNPFAAIVSNHLRMRPVYLLDGEPIGSDRSENDEELVTDGGVPRRDVLKAAGAGVALGSIPGVAQADEYKKGAELADGENPPVGSDAWWAQERRTLDLKSSVTHHSYVSLPREVWADAVERAARAGEPDRLGEYLLDYFFLHFAYVVGGEVVHADEGFDPGKVTTFAFEDPSGGVRYRALQAGEEPSLRP